MQSDRIRAIIKVIGDGLKKEQALGCGASGGEYGQRCGHPDDADE